MVQEAYQGIILNTCIFDNFIKADQLLAKVQRLEICLSVRNNLCRKLVSSLELSI